MKKLNTYSVYTLALRVHPLTELKHHDGMTLQDIFFPAARAEITLSMHTELPTGFFSPSLKRSAGTLKGAIYRVGVAEGENTDSDLTVAVTSYDLNSLVQKAKEFETVLANELPGLATYVVSQKGIYSTDELISQAEMHIPEKYRSVLNDKAIEDVQQAGKCLAFEVSTASAFHMWRAVESVMNSYYQALTGKTFAEANVVRNWGKYIEALEKANAEKRITKFLDHIREEYRNPINHPDETLDLDEAFGLFGAALSAITAITRAILEIQETAEARMTLAASAGTVTLGSLMSPLEKK
jgi:hypothetical protein